MGTYPRGASITPAASGRLAASAPGAVVAAITAPLAANEVGRQGRQSIVLAPRPAEFDRHVPALDEARFAQARNAATMGAYPSGDPLLRNPITGIPVCCARRERPRRCTGEQRDELATSQLIRLHSISTSEICRISNY